MLNRRVRIEPEAELEEAEKPEDREDGRGLSRTWASSN